MTTHPDASINTTNDALTALLDAGSTIELQTAGGVETATLTFGTPAFGASAARVSTANAITGDTNATGGLTTKGVCKNNAGTVIWEFTVSKTGQGGELELDENDIPPTATVNISTFTYQGPP